MQDGGEIVDAVRNGDVEAFSRAVQSGRDVVAVLVDGGTLLCLAARLGHHRLVSPLLQAGVGVDSVGHNSRTPLHEAAAAGHLHVAQVLADAGADIEAISDLDKGAKPLHLSSRGNHAALAAFLLERSADIEAPDKNGWGPLHEAAYWGHIDVIRVLVEAGADIEAAANGGWTPLMRASLWGHLDAVLTLLHLGANTDTKGSYDYTAVHYAASRGHIHVLEALQCHGANLGAICTNQGNAVHSAAGGGRFATVVWLKEHGVQHNLKDKNDRSPEDMAQLYGYHHVAYWLYKQDVDPDPRQHTQRADSQVECERIGLITINWVKEDNATNLRVHLPARPYRIHFQDDHGWTPLHHAAYHNKENALKALLDLGAHRNSHTHIHQTPWHLAEERGHTHLADLLKMNVPKLGKMKKVRMYGRLLRKISSAELVIHDNPEALPRTSDKADMARRGRVVSEVSQLLDDGCPLGPVGGHTIVALHLAITSNCTDLLPLMLSTGAPLTTTASGMSVLQLAWLCPDVTTFVAVMVTRAIAHKLDHELKRIKALMDTDNALKHGLQMVIDQVKGEEPWHAAWPMTSRNTHNLTLLLGRATYWGLPLTASFIQRAGGSVTTISNGGETALHMALGQGQYDTALCLIHHMRANIFIQDVQGRTPNQMLPKSKRRDMMEELLSHDYQKLTVMREKVRTQQEKITISSILLLLAVLYMEAEVFTKAGSWKFNLNWLMRLVKKVWEKEEQERAAGTFVSSTWMLDLLNEININQMKSQDASVDQSHWDANKEGGELEDFELEEEYFCQLIESLKQISEVKHSQETEELDSSTSQIVQEAYYLSVESNLTLFLHLLLTVAGVDINGILEPLSGSTALHIAAWRGSLGTCDYLLSRGALTEAADKACNTPAHLAYMFGHSIIGDRLVLGVKGRQNSAGKAPAEMLDKFKKYCSRYGLDNTAPIKVWEQNDASALIKAHLKHFRHVWEDITLPVKKLHVDFTTGEAKTIQVSLVMELRNIVRKLGEVYPLFEGNLVVLGSSADNLRLYAPDEFDCNIELKHISGFPDGGLDLTLKPVPPTQYKGHQNYLHVSTTRNDLRQLVESSNFCQTFFDALNQSLLSYEITDSRLSFVPPGVRKSGVGATVSFAWQGEEFPLLFIEVDLVPTMKAPWPEMEARPPLTPKDMDVVHLCNMSDGDWRYSFAIAENMILRNLTTNQRCTFLACKLLITALKVESWAPRDAKDKFTYWDGHRFKIPSPAGYILKAAFMKEMEQVKDDLMWGKERLLERMCSIFRRMCICEVNASTNTKEYYHAKMKPYFGGDTERPTIGLGAPEILKFLESSDVTTYCSDELHRN